MNRPLNVMKTDIEQTCFCCPVQTRLVLVEELYNFPLCERCLFTISAVELIAARVDAEFQTVN